MCIRDRDMPINMVLSADTGMEFPEMYAHLAKLDEHLYSCLLYTSSHGFYPEGAEIACIFALEPV